MDLYSQPGESESTLLYPANLYIIVQLVMCTLSLLIVLSHPISAIPDLLRSLTPPDTAKSFWYCPGPPNNPRQPD